MVSEIWKTLPTDFSDNANKTSVFVSRWFCAEGFFYNHLTHQPNIWLACRPRSPTQVGRPRCHGDCRDRRQTRLKLKKMKFTWLFCLDRKMTKRRNGETCPKRLICQQDHHSGTVLVLKWSCFCFVQEFCRFVVSMRHLCQQRIFFCVK